MDYDFFEQSYYYTQPGPQGEMTSDDLSWLIYLVVTNFQDPKEQVGKTTEVLPETIVSPLKSIPILPDEQPILSDEQEVISENPQVTVTNHDSVTETPIKYELPSKSTRGVPSYDLEFEAQRSKYPVCRESNKALSQSTMAFKCSLYTKSVPKNVEEAL